MDKPAIPDNHVLLQGGKGFINVGSHPSNDLVIAGDNVLPFHMMVDFRQTPYRLIPLSADAQIRLNQEVVSPDQASLVETSDIIDIGGNQLKIYPPFNGTPVSLGVLGTQADRGVVSVGYQAPTLEAAPATPPPPVPGGAPNLPRVPGNGHVLVKPGSVQQDEVILVSIDHDSAQINVDQTATFVLTVINGSPIVSTFNVRIEGIPEEWTIISPANVNLYEGSRADIQINITPPRRPTSTAGNHPFRFVVTSFNHPGRQSVLSASIDIAPYYDYAIGDVNPRKKTISWRQAAGTVGMDVTNRGNSQALFNIMAQDEENGCNFQFTDVNGLKQIGSVQYNLLPGTTQPVDIRISPQRRSLVALRSRNLPYRVVVNQPQNEAVSLFTMGTAVARPLINIIGVILFLLCLAGLITYIFTPRINTFTADSNVIGVGESVTLAWKSPIFTHDLKLSGTEEPLSSSQGTIDVIPASTVNTYTLTASTWLWSLLGLEPKTSTVTVLAVPEKPDITTFSVTSDDVIEGDQITLRWSVEHATKVLLTINGVTDTLEDAKDFNGERAIVVEKSTLISIVAQNAIGSTVQSLYVNASAPSIVIEDFELSDTTVYTGDQVTVKWKVSGVGMDNGGSVTISAFDSVLPLEGELTFFPESSMEFVLTATNRALTESRILPVGVLAPEDPPVPPTIDFFKAVPETLTGPGSVELSWSVSGLVDKIYIKNTTTTVATDLSAQGFKSLPISASGTYVLTAEYSGKTAGSNLQITVNPALIEPLLEISSVYPSDNTILGDSVAVSISISNPAVDDPPITGQVIVSDGSSSCVIELPKTNCTFKFETPGSKTLTATYQGDDNHVQTTSKPFGTVIEVEGTDITLETIVLPTTTPYAYNQKLSMNVTVAGTNPNQIPDGEIRIRRMCDSTATYATPCTNAVIGYHKLTAADSGAYNFTGLTVDQFGGNWTLQVTFSGDSFYSNTSADLKLPITNVASPVSISAATTTTFPGLTSAPVMYTITVQDDNAAGVYSNPLGKIDFIATHTDGTVVDCLDVDLTANVDGRTSSATCELDLTKSGEWALSGSYKKSTSDITHETTDKTFNTIVINSATTMALPSTASLIYGTQSTFTIDLSRTENSAAISTGTLGCEFANGSTDGTCTCNVSGSPSVWRCYVTATLADALPVDRNVTYTYTPPAGSFLNSVSQTKEYTINKANTTVSLNEAITAGHNYEANNSSYSLVINADNSDGGTDPVGGTTTATLGTGTCDPQNGMNGNVLATFSSMVEGESTLVSFTSDHVGNSVHFCYRYEGSNGYSASSWTVSPDFNITTQGTTASIETNPTPLAASYTKNTVLNVTVKAFVSGSSTSLTTGSVSIQVGTGSCASTGMASGVLKTFSGTVNTPVAITLDNTYIVGSDVRICAYYQGVNKQYAASTYTGTSAFRVKATPTWSDASAQTFIANSSISTVTQTITVVLNNAYSPADNGAKLVLSSDTTTAICPSSTASLKCVLSSKSTSGTATTYTFNIGSTTANTWTVKPYYVEDANNATTTGNEFTLSSLYKVVWDTNTYPLVDITQTSNPTIRTYSLLETVADIWGAAERMVMNFKAKFHFENVGYSSAGVTLTPKLIATRDDNTTFDIDSADSSCTLDTSGTNPEVTCYQTKFRDHTVKAVAIALVPTSGDESKYNGSLTSTSASVNIIENVIENPSNTNYSLHASCSNPDEGADTKTELLTITGFANSAIQTSESMDNANWQYELRCAYAAAEDWCYTFYSGAKNSPSWFTQKCDSDNRHDYPNSSISVTWDTTVTPPKFTITVKNTSFQGCPGRGGIIQQDSGVQFELHTGDSDYEDFYFKDDDLNRICED